MKRSKNPRRLVDRKWLGILDRNLPWLYNFIRKREYPQRYTPESKVVHECKEQQSNFCLDYLEKIRAVKQTSSASPLKVPLSYHPIAKNIRQLATALHYATTLNRPLVIANENPREEKLFALQGRGDWHPWLWGRIENARDLVKENSGREGRLSTAESWNLFFNDAVPAETSEKKSRPTSKTKIPAWQRNLLEMATCVAETFVVRDHVKHRIDEWEASMGFPADTAVLGIHIRRGDAASENLMKSTRNSVALDDYLTTADQLCSTYNINTIYLSTESKEEIDQARKSRPEYHILSLPHDRSVFPVIEDESRFIEDLALDHPEVIGQIVYSALADLHFLSRCNAFIGTFNSEFSMLAWLLCLGHHKHFVPYVDMICKPEHRSYQGHLQFWMDPPLN